MYKIIFHACIFMYYGMELIILMSKSAQGKEHDLHTSLTINLFRGKQNITNKTKEKPKHQCGVCHTQSNTLVREWGSVKVLRLQSENWLTFSETMINVLTKIGDLGNPSQSFKTTLG